MKTCTKPNKVRPAGSLVAAVTALVGAVGGLERAADIVGKSRNTIWRYTDPDGGHEDRAMPVQIVRLLEAYCGDPVVTRFLANEAGCTLFRLPRTVGGEWGADIGRLSGETADVINALATALDNDGRIDAREAGEGIDQIDEAMAVLASMRGRLVPIRDKDGAQ